VKKMKTIIAILVLAASVGVAESMTNSTLRADLSSPDFETRRRATIELHKLGDNSGVPAMIEAMGTLTNQTERNNAVVALRITKDPRAIPALTKATSDPSAYVRSIAVAALGELAATNAYNVIVSHVTDLENFGGDVPMCPGDSACYALGALGDKRALPVLIKALDQRETQSQACQALEKLTGQAFRYDVEKWKAWWKEKRPNIERVSTSP
jgi:HEAT repeat protein